MSADPPRFLRPREHISKSGGKLPHWEQDGVTFFVTFRLADSLPETFREDWSRERESWLKRNPKPWSKAVEQEYAKTFSRKLEEILDRGYGSCALRCGGARDIVAAALLHFDEVRYSMHAFVVMPNHVHALFSIANEQTLAAVIASWKSFTAKMVNRLLDRCGSFWQRDYHDRMIRDWEHFGNCVRYVKNNPLKATLPAGEFTSFESDYVREIGIDC